MFIESNLKSELNKEKIEYKNGFIRLWCTEERYGYLNLPDIDELMGIRKEKLI